MRLLSITVLSFFNNKGDQDIEINGLRWAVQTSSGKLPRRKTGKILRKGLYDGQSVIFLLDQHADGS